LGYFTYIWDILRTFGIFYDHSVHFGKFISGFGIMYQEKSGNPGWIVPLDEMEFATSTADVLRN
jgi:hypothetical protein